MQFPSPDLVVEVLSESTERHDRETKFQDYAAHGVSEYWIVDPENETVEQYMHQDGEYELLLKSQDGHIKSVAVDGLSIPVRAIFDKKEMMNCLREILASARPD
jgi:Uma2 family endonuclease